jgi:subtilisin family serine protease
VVRAASFTAGDPPSWGLNRVDQPSLPLSAGAPFSAAFDGTGQTVYIVDTGLTELHDQFVTWSAPGKQSGRRSRLGGDFINEASPGDGHGHGTHCAGTAAGGSFGIARGASVVGVKALAASGSGATSAVVEGIAWATQDSAGKAGVISLSLGTTANAALDGAVRAAASAGMIVVVAAGNEKKDACKVSPARVGGKAATTGVITVGATDSSDTRAWFSNYGKCVDLFAPGYAILSAWKDSPSATRFISGTSQATPHVAGAAAVLLQKHAGNRAAAVAELLAIAVAGKVKDAKGSKNLLLQVPQPAGTGTPAPAPTMPPTVALPTICVKGTGGAIVACADYGFAAGVFGPVFSPTTTQISGGLAVAKTDLCLPTTESFAGKVVLVARGNCLFYQKTMAAQKAGAKAVVVYNSDDLDPFPPNYSGGAVAPAIMTLMIYQRDGLGFAKLAGQAGLTVVIGR